MFRLEKVFQKDDLFFIYIYNISKLPVLYFTLYIGFILKDLTIYDLNQFSLFYNSEYFLLVHCIFFSYFFFQFLFENSKIFKTNFISFLKNDIKFIFLSFVSFFIIAAFLKTTHYYSRAWILYMIGCSIINLFFLKIIFNLYYEYLIERNIIQRNILIVGTYDSVKKLIKTNKNKINIYKCAIILDIIKLKENLIKSEIKFPIFNLNDDPRIMLEYHELGQIWILKNDQIKNYENILEKFLKFSVDIKVLDIDGKFISKSDSLINNLFHYSEIENSKFYGPNLFLKIIFDKIFSVFFIILSLPIFLFAILAIYIEDGFPVIFSQDRTGWDGRRFEVYKLRSLKSSKFDKTVQVTKDDERLLRCGKFIRKFSIDELPQFFNVLIGDMSIVGPRPHMVKHDMKYSTLFDNFLKRHKCNPGITGWAQVNGYRGATPTPDLMERRMEHDLWYLKNWTIWLDFYIMIKTFYVVFRYKGD